MVKNKFLLLLLTASIILTGPAYSVNCMEVLEKEEEEVSEEDMYLQEEDTTIPIYFEDEEFQKFLDSCIEKYEAGNTTALQELYMFVISRNCSEDQVKEILKRGYLVGYIDEFKESDILPDDYKLPDGVEIHQDKVFEGKKMEGNLSDYYSTYEDPSKEYVHDISGLSANESEQIMVDRMQDNVIGNAYVMCPKDSEDKQISGQMLKISAFRGEPLQIMFTEDELVSYMWTFGGIYYMDKDYLDLNVDYNGDSLSFDLGNTLPHPAYLTLHTDKPAGTIVEFKDKDGNIVYSLEVDEDGYITLDNVYRDGNYNIRYELIKIGDDTKTDKVQELPALNEIPIISNIWILISVLILMAAGTVFATLSIIKAQKK